MDKEPNLVWDESEIEEGNHEFEWEHLTDCLTDFMKKINPDSRLWYAKVENFGWLHQSGEAEFEAKDGRSFLTNTLPRTECTFKIWVDEEAKKITIDNAHHDAPMGGEMYYVTPQLVETT